MSSSVNYVSRVNQLDADALDNELLAILKRNLLNGLEHIQHNWLLSLEPEIIFAIRLLLWHFSVNSDGATVGQKLFELRYHNLNGKPISNAKSYLLALFQIVVPWVRCRLPKLVSQQKVQILDSLDTVLKTTELINFMVFLHQGKFSSLVERILAIRHSHSNPQQIRQVQYEYMNRELLWNGIAEFISFAIPLINLRRIRNVVLCMIWPKALVPSLVEHRTKDDLGSCGICRESPIVPHDMGCRHVFCYYCLMSAVMADPRFHCPICHHQADGCNSVHIVLVT